MIIRRLVLLFLTCAGAVTVAQTTQPARQVNLLAMGDWGTGNDNQRAVARAMASFASETRIDAMLLAGDNFYNDLKSVDDPEWAIRFEQMYDRNVLNFPFYATLGNHDYEKDEWKVQLEYPKAHPESRFKLYSQWYRIGLPVKDPLITILMLDSNKTLLGDEKWNEQKRWLHEQLSSPKRTKWTIAVAHHPLWSNGSHGDNGVLQKEWGPIFSEFGLDLYVCGHDHDLQHLQIENFPVSLVLCGGGGANIRPMAVDKRGPFSKSAFGFAYLAVSEDELRVRLIDKDLNRLHEFVRRSDERVEVTFTTPSDVATPRTPKSVTRGDDSDRKPAK